METRILPARPEFLDEATAFVEEMLESDGCPMKTVLQVRLAVEEIFINIASYAYPSGGGQAELRCELLPDPKRIRICFIIDKKKQRVFIPEGVFYGKSTGSHTDKTE